MKRILLLVGWIGFVCIYSCKKKSDPAPAAQQVESGNAVDNYVKPLQQALQPEERTPKMLIDSEFEKDGDYSCKTTTYTAGFGFDENLCLDPQSDVIYPGSLVNGNSVVTGEYQPVNLKRNGITLSTTLVTADKGSSVVVPEAKLSTVRSAISELLGKDLQSPPPAVLSYELIEVFSESQFLASVGAGVGSAKFNVKGSFDFSSTSKTSKFLLKFVQHYYSMDVDLPTNPSDFISTKNSLDDIKAQLSNAAPCYVSSVKYGRLAFFYLESTENRQAVKAALEATFKGGAVNASLETEFNKYDELKNLKISGTVIGGSGSDAAGTIAGKDSMFTYITKGGKYSKESPGAPLAYTLRTLSDNKIFRVVKATQYTMRECTKNLKGIKLTNFRAWGQDAQIFGRVDVILGYDGDGDVERKTLWEKGRDQASGIPQNGSGGEASGEVNFVTDFVKKDKAYIRIETWLYDRDDRAVCDTRADNFSKDQCFDADDEFNNVGGKFYISNKANKEGLILETDGKLYLNRIGVKADMQVCKQKSDETISCNNWGGFGNPQIDVFFSFIE